MFLASAFDKKIKKFNYYLQVLGQNSKSLASARGRPALSHLYNTPFSTSFPLEIRTDRTL